MLLADPVGVNTSLGEGLVTGPGVRYAVEPVEAPAGVFHAKVGVLWSHECLMIAVGSGNLTFAGMHRNLECWEVLTAGIEASPARQLPRPVAEDALAFLAHLKGRVEPGGRAASTLATAIAAVTSWLPKLSSDGAPVRWIDSTREPIGDQLARHLGERTNRTLQVLSPFHDRDGRAIERLASRLGASVDVLFTGSTTAYPLHEKAYPVTTRRIAIDDPSRTLHAKVFHVVDDAGAHLLSGSANATSAALWTTGNIEVSLLRSGEFEAFIASEPSTPKVAIVEYEKPHARPLTIQWARAASDHVRAHLRWLGDDTRPGELEVGFVDSLEPPTAIEWPADDIVRVRLPATFNALRPRAVRLEVTTVASGKRCAARSWVAFDELLNATLEFRAALSAWNRRLFGEDGDADAGEDDAVLLRMFAEEHAHTIDVIGSDDLGPRQPRDAEEPGDDDDVSIPLHLIEALTRLPLPPHGSGAGTTPDLISDVERAMRAAFALLGEKDLIDDEEDEGVFGDPPPPAKRSPARLPRSVREALDDFERTFVAAANAIQRPPARPAAVLAYSSLCVRLALRYRLQDGGNIAAFWSSGDTLVRALLCPLTKRAPLVSLLRSPGAPIAGDWAELLALLIALLAWHERGGRMDGEKITTRRSMPAEVTREALAVLDRAAESPVEPSPLPPTLEKIFPEPPAKLTDLLAEMRGTPSASERALSLKAHLEAVMRKEALPTTDEADREVANDARHTPPLFVTPWRETCAHCHQMVAGALRSELLQRKHVRCRNMRCSRWLVPSEGA